MFTRDHPHNDLKMVGKEKGPHSLATDGSERIMG